MTDERPLFELRAVNKWFGDLHVLCDVSLSIARSERVVICGPSGSGKSTLIRCLNQLEHHQEGEIFFEGRLVGLLLTGWTAEPDVLARAVATARAF